MLLLLLILVTQQGCRKNEQVANLDELSGKVLHDVSVVVVHGSFQALKTQSDIFKNSISAYVAQPDQAHQEAARVQWRAVRAAWEQCEGFLWGPVSTSGYDPRTDTWPINFTDMTAMLNDTVPITDSLLTTLDDALKGYHPIEYLLWGTDGNRQPAALTAREWIYLTVLSNDLGRAIDDLYAAYDLSTGKSYLQHLLNPVSGGIYPTKRAAFEELVNGISGICEEVADGKIEEPFSQQEPTKEESPYSKNSWVDFANNIRSVQNVYMGQLGQTKGSGLSAFVHETNASLDARIQSEIAVAIASIEAVPVPFGDAIISHQTQVLAAQQAIRKLGSTLSDDLLPLIQQHVK